MEATLRFFTCSACGQHVGYEGMFPGVYMEIPHVSILEAFFCTPECAIKELQDLIDERVAQLLLDLEDT